MNTGSAKQSRDPSEACKRMMGQMEEGANPMGACPMGAMCKAMMERGRFGLLLMIAGLALLAGGILILFEPRVLIWLLAGASILLGVAMLVGAVLAHRIAARTGGT